jgi:hypothetical protein
MIHYTWVAEAVDHCPFITKNSYRVSEDEGKIIKTLTPVLSVSRSVFTYNTQEGGIFLFCGLQGFIYLILEHILNMES